MRKSDSFLSGGLESREMWTSSPQRNTSISIPEYQCVKYCTYAWKYHTCVQYLGAWFWGDGDRQGVPYCSGLC